MLYRVAQDCAAEYGRRIRCMRVTRLAEDQFEEAPVSDWPPGARDTKRPWHTFNRVDDLTVVDRLVRRFRYRPGARSSP
jgi:hypothetical protein